MNYYIPVTMPGGIPCGPPVEIPSQMLLACQEVNSLREQLRSAILNAQRMPTPPAVSGEFLPVAKR